MAQGPGQCRCGDPLRDGVRLAPLHGKALDKVKADGRFDPVASARHGPPSRLTILPADRFGVAASGAVKTGLRPAQIRQGEGHHDLITGTDVHTALTSGESVKIQPQRLFCFDAASKPSIRGAE